MLSQFRLKFLLQSYCFIQMNMQQYCMCAGRQDLRGWHRKRIEPKRKNGLRTPFCTKFQNLSSVGSWAIDFLILALINGILIKECWLLAQRHNTIYCFDFFHVRRVLLYRGKSQLVSMNCKKDIAN